MSFSRIIYGSLDGRSVMLILVSSWLQNVARVLESIEDIWK